MSAASSIARLKVTLDDVKPKVLRRIDVPADMRLDRLHLTLQAALGWENCHLYEFRAGGLRWGMPDPDFDGGPRDARKARLIDILNGAGTGPFSYIYDFGDNWQHTVAVEQVTDAAPGVVYPVLVEVDAKRKSVSINRSRETEPVSGANLGRWMCSSHLDSEAQENLAFLDEYPRFVVTLSDGSADLGGSCAQDAGSPGAVAERPPDRASSVPYGALLLGF